MASEFERFLRSFTPFLPGISQNIVRGIERNRLQEQQQRALEQQQQQQQALQDEFDLQLGNFREGNVFTTRNLTPNLRIAFNETIKSETDVKDQPILDRVTEKIQLGDFDFTNEMRDLSPRGRTAANAIIPSTSLVRDTTGGRLLTVNPQTGDIINEEPAGYLKTGVKEEFEETVGDKTFKITVWNATDEEGNNLETRREVSKKNPDSGAGDASQRNIENLQKAVENNDAYNRLIELSAQQNPDIAQDITEATIDQLYLNKKLSESTYKSRLRNQALAESEAFKLREEAVEQVGQEAVNAIDQQMREAGVENRVQLAKDIMSAIQTSAERNESPYSGIQRQVLLNYLRSFEILSRFR